MTLDFLQASQLNKHRQIDPRNFLKEKFEILEHD